MYKHVVACLLCLASATILISPASCYSRVLSVTVHAGSSVKAGEPVLVIVYIHTGNNRLESVEDVRATLVLPEEVELTLGVNPVFIGEMGPGPGDASCNWTVVFRQSGTYTLVVNTSCVDTQRIPRWLMNSTLIEVYDIPHVEFEHSSNAYANRTVVFNATQSRALGSDSRIVTYEWSFGDDSNITMSDAVVEHEFSAVGDYLVSLRITDNRGLSNVTTVSLRINLFGDFNLDDVVNIVDVSLVSISFGSRLGDARWNATCDLNQDNVVDILDVSLVAREYGKTG